eukprot:CAMPEP_0179474884 /NCGR_PEP_ID=MMETSP0799-20121207/54233_1 /TAXON_ID=46947 /ORGANISM="Geminigera cryophila, Strain CCMP2564" /LENGTH=53 /DNA_ID=CAMNT_0021284179 /DNA_START=442 /DNA_END=600 /DNA_ORIENTATION=+
MTPHFRSGLLGGAELGNGTRWNVFVYAVSDQLHHMDASFHQSLCQTLKFAAEE